MLNRRAFLLGSIATAFAKPLVASAQPVVNRPRVGFLSASSPTGDAAARRAFLEGLAAHGWVERENIIVETRHANGDYNKLTNLAAELIGLNVAVIAAGNVAAAAARRITTTVPIVMTNQADPVGNGLVRSLRQPGGNVTGVTWDPDPAITGKSIELLSEIVPRLDTVGVILDPSPPGVPIYQNAADGAALRLNLKLHYAEVRSESDVAAAFERLSRAGAKAVVVFASPFIASALSGIVAHAAKHRLAAIYGFPRSVEQGGLRPRPLHPAVGAAAGGSGD